ncbi:RT0821/Lpp0805 family surface protein [Pannonibacter carbonis]|uniref:RT0821/Lpp0805 family surface protein n=1 Tax=Pannonibacter carbonis TaxID=2067569 RepID=UPI000D103EE3|nr:RT0821/Lpp0805 family surface protein [Pannonibacter carbonis]
MRNLPYPGSLSKRLGLLATFLSVNIGLGACAQISGPLATSDVVDMSDVTGSIDSAGASAGNGPVTEVAGASSQARSSDIDATDRKLIALAIATAPAPGNAISIPWLNPASGNSGTIIALTPEGRDLLGCVAFRTTANTIQGVRAYDGNACRDARQQMAVINLAEAKI